MSSPRVTIITPTYKHEQYIGECIESVLAQSFGDWEQIILDDCSPDGTLDVVSRYKDPRIRVVRKSVRGGPASLGVTYNTALQMARGEFVAILEGDDYWPADKLAIQVPAHRKDCIASWGPCALKFDDRLQMPRKRWHKKPWVYPSLKTLLIGNVIPAVSAMIRRQELISIGGFWQPEGAMLVDYPTWLRLTRHGNILCIPHMLGVWRRHAAQITQAHEGEIMEAAIRYVADVFCGLPEKERTPSVRLNYETGQLLRHASLAIQKGETQNAMRLYRRVLCMGPFKARWFVMQFLMTRWGLL